MKPKFEQVDKHNINTYSKLEQGASFFLQESFHHIHSALSSEFAAILLAEELEKLEPTKADREKVKNIDLPEDTVGLLQSIHPDPLTDKTLGKISSIWEKSQHIARIGKYPFGLKHRIDSIEILGHLNNFGFFIETLVNRHLLFLQQTKVIDEFSYARISTAKVMERLIYIFKEDLNKGKIHLNEIVNLFSLRNKTVHFTPDNANALKPMISELIQIWNQSANLIKKLESKEKFNEEKFSNRRKRPANYILAFDKKPPKVAT